MINEILQNKIIELGTLQKPKISGDFIQVKRKVENGIDFEIHEYGNPKHNYWGYQIVFYETREDGEYYKSVGYGKEAKSRTFNWTKIIKL